MNLDIDVYIDVLSVVIALINIPWSKISYKLRYYIIALYFFLLYPRIALNGW